MKKRVLWLDNDEAYVEPYREELERHDILAKVVTNVTEAENLLNSEINYDLMIIDVMIPTKTEAEETDYPPEETNSGLKTGLIFFRRMQPRLKAQGTAVIVMTVRLDKGIREEFRALGLDESFYFTKMTLRETPVFVEKIKSILEQKNQHK
jgi:CheY-like chemotaxis protein